MNIYQPIERKDEFILPEDFVITGASKDVQVLFDAGVVTEGSGVVLDSKGTSGGNECFVEGGCDASNFRADENEDLKELSSTRDLYERIRGINLLTSN